MQDQDQPGGPRMIPMVAGPQHPGGGPPRLKMKDFARRTVVAVLIAVLIVALTAVLWRGIHVLLQAFAGLLFAVFLSALADWLSRHTRLPYRWSLAAVVLLLFVIASGLGYLLWNRLSTQVGELTQTLPQSMQRIKSQLEQYPWGQYLVQQAPDAATTLAQVSRFTHVTGLISGVSDFLVTVVVIFFVGVFGAAEPEMYRQGLYHLVPARHRPRVSEAVRALAFNLRWWLLGQVFLMIVIGITTTVGLWIIGVRLALTLGIIAGLMEMVPYVGPWISAVPAVLIALLAGPDKLLETLGLYLFLHVLEGYVLLPIVQRRAVEMPPALTLVAQVLLGDLLGLMGLFVAAPLTVSVVVLLKMLYVEDTLGDQAVNVPGEPGNEEKPSLQGPEKGKK